jgi:hypothetical protein
MIKEEGCHLFKRMCPNIHGTVDAITGLYPVRFPGGDVPSCGFSPVPILNIKNVTAQDHGYAVKRVAVPRSSVSGGKPQPPDQVVSTTVQYLFMSG